MELQDSNGAIPAHGGNIHDCAPRARRGKTSTASPRHPNPAVLDSVKDLPLLLHYPLKGGAKLGCDVHSQRGAASTAAKTATITKGVWLRRGVRDLRVEAQGNLPHFARPGDVLTGTVKLHKGLGDGVKALPLSYEAPPAVQGQGQRQRRRRQRRGGREGTRTRAEERGREGRRGAGGAAAGGPPEAPVHPAGPREGRRGGYRKLADALLAEKPGPCRCF